MAVREFNGSSDDIVRDIGALSGMTYGTVAAFVRPVRADSFAVIAGLTTSGGTDRASVAFNDDGDDWWLEWFNDDDLDGDESNFASFTNDWWIVVWRKGTGNAVARMSVYDLSTWVHDDLDFNGSTVGEWLSPGVGGVVAFSSIAEGDFFYAGRVAAVAVWSNSLGPSDAWSADSSGDTAIEAAGLETALSNWADADPDALWAFNQLQTSDDVLDTVGAAFQTSITGTTVVTDDDPPGFDFGPTVRAFEDTEEDDLVTATGALSGMTYGAVAVVFQQSAADGGDRGLFTGHDSGGTNRFAVYTENTTGNFGVYNGAGASTTSTAAISPGDWILAVFRKDTGTSSTRFSVYNFATDSWQHDGAGSLADWSSFGAGGFIAFSNEGTDGFPSGLIAARAAWSNSLGPGDAWTADASGDSAIEAAGLETHLSYWSGAFPDALWVFNQESTATSVDDLTGNGANQSSISGTYVLTGDPPPNFSFEFEPVRRFDSSNSDDLVTSIGALSSMTHGTIAALVKPVTDTDDNSWIQIQDFSGGGTGVTVLGLGLDTDFSDNWINFFNGTSVAEGNFLDWEDRWYLVVVRKGDGSVTPRMSAYDYVAQNWFHDPVDFNTATLANWSAPGADSEVAFSDQDGMTSGFHFNGQIAVRACWSNSLGPSDAWTADGSGDTAIEAAGLETSLQNWVNASPDALWRFNQDSIGTAVNDLVGDADQVSITGTSVITSDPVPGFSYELTTGNVTASVSHGLVLGHDVAADVIVDATVSHGLALTHDVDVTVGGVVMTDISHGLVLGHDVAADVVIDATVEHGLVLGHEMSISIASDVDVDLSHGLVLGHEMSAETVQTTQLKKLRVVILQEEEA